MRCIIDIDTQREYFMECVYDILSDDETNDRANQIIDVFDSLGTENESAGKKENGGWIKCSERMPEEHDSCLAKWYGTSKWTDAMWRKQSDDVLVTMEFEDGARKTEKMKTHDGKWFYDIYVVKFNVVAWQPLPEPYKESEEDAE